MPDNPAPKGRGSHINPPNRFGLPLYQPDLEQLEGDADALEELRRPATVFIPDRSKSVVTENHSPDIPFRYSLNPYRGCEHGCSYCYARPTHEYLGFSAGLDFETKIVVKEDAPGLFRDFLAHERWRPESITLSGVTDCYQPAERRFLLTRRCLEVAVEARQPITIITKNALVLRDLDLLRDLAADALVHVVLSVTTLDAALARAMEPRTSSPAARLGAVRALADAGVPVMILVAPVIPGLNDAEIPAILAAAKEAGAGAAGRMLLRLPLTVAPVFLEWLKRERPEAAGRVEGRIRDVRGGKLNQSAFGERMRGSGEMAKRIGDLFRLFARRHGLDGDLPPLECTKFRPPRSSSGERRLF
ncbi:MAG TPA: PA0069 family radical SAM protein [Gemmataceae bacterium]|nr:PA0069 family radical SAM protein [Gemmataceae bacterium]